jgi:glycine/D-amino acid oxidase-like deaminating enzyme
MSPRTPDQIRRLSLWHDTLDEDILPRAALPGSTQADVAIVGAGYTGLWTAYYLTVADPGLRVVLIEREFAGFGASGRNGGWCSALFPVTARRLAAVAGRAGALAQQRALDATVTEVGRVAALDGIDAQFARGGAIALARTPVQLERARDEVDRARAFGLGEDHIRLLDAAPARAVLGATEVLGATYAAHCAALHPARLVRGLATTVEGRGVRLYERTAARAIAPGRVVTDQGTVHAPYVVRATEGYTADLRGQGRTLAPVYSLMLATEVLPTAFWDAVGLRRREVFTDHRHLIIYGQRTADDRLAFGGRGAPYHWGSRTRCSFEREPTVFAGLHRALVELFPAVADAAITHTWGGPLGIARDWFPSVGLDRVTGLGWGLRRRWRGRGQSGRAYARRSDHRAGERSDHPAVGPAPLAPLGAGAAALVGDDRDPAPGGRRGRE